MNKIEICINDATKIIKGTPVLKNITLQMEGGKCYGFRGKNGCGKTMLMRAICGLIHLSSGKITINGKILHKDIDFPESIGVLIENPSFIDYLTGLENLKLLSDLKDKLSTEELGNVLTAIGLNPKDKRVYRKYSLGMKQKLGIAAAVMGSPDIVILDEPINAIDQEGVILVRKILSELKEKGSIIVIACHDHEELQQLADVIIPIENGRLVYED